MNHVNVSIAQIAQFPGPAPMHRLISSDKYLSLKVLVLEQQFAWPADGGRDLLLEYRQWIDRGREALGSGLHGCFVSHLGISSTHALHVGG